MKLFIISLFSVIFSSCCRNNDCPIPVFNDWLNNSEASITFQSNSGDLKTINLDSKVSSYEIRRKMGCPFCHSDVKIEGDFQLPDDTIEISLTLIAKGETTDDSLGLNSLNFEIDKYETSYYYTTNEFSDSSIYFGNYQLYDDKIITETYQFKKNNGSISEFLFSIDEGLIQFTTVDSTIWKRKF